MTRRRKVDASKVIEAVESGRLSRDVMDGFGLEKPSPPAGRRRRGRRKSGEEPMTGIVLGDVTVSKRGSLVLPRALVQELGLSEEETYIVRKTKAGIILKVV